MLNLQSSIFSTQTTKRTGLGWMAAVAGIAMLAAGAGAQQPGPLYGPSGVTPAAVRQGTLGSCYFHASLAAVAKADPAAIKKSLSGDATHGYKVHFLTGPEELEHRR